MVVLSLLNLLVVQTVRECGLLNSTFAAADAPPTVVVLGGGVHCDWDLDLFSLHAPVFVSVDEIAEAYDAVASGGVCVSPLCPEDDDRTPRDTIKVAVHAGGERSGIVAVREAKARIDARSRVFMASSTAARHPSPWSALPSSSSSLPAPKGAGNSARIDPSAQVVHPRIQLISADRSARQQSSDAETLLFARAYLGADEVVSPSRASLEASLRLAVQAVEDADAVLARGGVRRVTARAALDRVREALRERIAAPAMEARRALQKFSPTSTLRVVCYYTEEPFTIYDETKSGNDRFSGYLIDVWKAVADEL